MAKLPMQLKYELIEALDDVLTGFLAPRAARARGAIEDLLVVLLDDERVHGSMSTRGEVHPRTCDLASSVLAGNWSEKYRFEITASVRACDRRIAEIRNTWRSERGLPSLPVPPGPDLPPRVPDAETEPLIAAVQAGRDETDLKRHLVALEELGIGVLPAIVEHLQRLHAEHPAPEKPPPDELVELAGRLSTVVTEVSVHPKSRPLDEALRSRLESLRGKALTGVSLVAAGRAQPPPRVEAQDRSEGMT